MAKNKTDTFWREYLRREIEDIKSPSLYRACAAEFIGVFMLAFYGVGCNILSGDFKPVSSVHVALETGFYIAVAITIFSKVSGGHVNPSISMGFFVTGQISTVRFVLYVICQTLGAVSGAGIIYAITDEHIRGGFGVILPNPHISDGQAIVCEMIITFMMLFGTFAMIDEGRDDVHGFAPLMIGLLVSINVLCGWNISGGCMNPARNLGPAIMTGKLDKMWLYWIGDLVGATAGALLYDRIFSTKVCLRWMSEGCYSKRADGKKIQSDEKSVIDAASGGCNEKIKDGVTNHASNIEELACDDYQLTKL
ncbi:aquaporin AQPAn.G-like [Mytilus californianus]|uniref:aquaporin AQPAn.G-like n=1 Tax=Mytilus californianus TaxID=6549 RepID=UPI0022480523|nr:aquaporin AQPAn.G-like [Mytilus californianus]